MDPSTMRTVASILVVKALEEEDEGVKKAPQAGSTGRRSGTRGSIPSKPRFHLESISRYLGNYAIADLVNSRLPNSVTFGPSTSQK